MTQGTRHIIVVGAGIVGVSAAILLRRDGHEVTLVDRAGPGDGTSFGNGGVACSCTLAGTTSLVLQCSNQREARIPTLKNDAYIRDH